MVFASFATVFVITDDTSADSVSSGDILLSDTVEATGGKITATIKFYEQDHDIFSNMTYTAKLVNSKGVSQSSALSRTAGSTTETEFSEEITVTLPSTAGTYTLEVTFTERYSSTSDLPNKVFTVSKTLEAREPVTLSVTLKNTGSLAINGTTVYFYVDGKKIDDSEQKISIEADGSKTVTYKYFDKNLTAGRHTYCLDAGDHAYTIEGLGVEYEFYYHQGDYNYLIYLIVVVLVILVVFAVWVFRKPVKNYGKPKARR